MGVAVRADRGVGGAWHGGRPMTALWRWMRGLSDPAPERSGAVSPAPIILSSISYDRAGCLRCRSDGRRIDLIVAADDRPAFLAALHQAESVVEFRSASLSDEVRWYILITQDGDGAGSWHNGLIVARQGPSFVARSDPTTSLATISAMVSEFRHELRQPIAAISLAAANGAATLRSGQPERALAKFELVLDQVDRCDELFGRNARDMYSDGSGWGNAAAGEALHQAIADLRPSLVEAEIEVGLTGAVQGAMVAMPFDGLVNTLRAALVQAIDAIRIARLSGLGDCRGRISIDMRREPGALVLVIGDDGASPPPGRQREGLALTMGRYLVERAGGTAAFTGGANFMGEAGRLGGGALTIRLPIRNADGSPAISLDQPRDQELASSLR